MIYDQPTVFTADSSRPIRTPVAPRLTADLDLGQMIRTAAQRHQVSPELVTAVAWRESAFRQAAISNRDAVGVMQLTAATARDLGVDRYDTAQNINGGTAYLRRLLDRYRGDVRLALAAYNAGPAAVDRFGGVPPFRETTAYVTAILARVPPRILVPSALSLVP